MQFYQNSQFMKILLIWAKVYAVIKLKNLIQFTLDNEFWIENLCF